ncbi:hypothetical protein AB205_0029900, partial [Aquarana catesbeiana]
AMVEHMAEKEQVHAEESSNEESPEERRFKASNMSFMEMLEMVDILKRADYDGKRGPYLNPNVRKAKIMAKVVKSLHRNFGVMWMLWKKICKCTRPNRGDHGVES